MGPARRHSGPRGAIEKGRNAPVSSETIIFCRQLVTCAPGGRPRGGDDARDVGAVDDAALVVRDGLVVWTGPRAAVSVSPEAVIVDRSGSCVVPGLVDAHTHPVWSGSRTAEFRLRAQGATYLEIHKAGGGILSTVRASREATDDALVAHATAVLRRMLAHGTTTVEAKSGYGLDEAQEIRQLVALREAGRALPLRVVPTYLGAHALPPEYADRREDFVDLVVDRVLPRVAREGLAEFCDVFCEDGAFTLEESRRILQAARDLGLKLKIHAEEFAYLGGAVMAASLGATSVDHLLSLPSEDFPTLRKSGAVAVLLPSTTLFLGKERYAPGRGLLDAGVPVAIATDFNAGSCMSESLPMAMSLGVIKLKMTPEEAIIAGTVNGAHAVGRGHACGSLEPGKQADFLVLDVPGYDEWLYHVGVNLVREVWIQGERVEGRLK